MSACDPAIYANGDGVPQDSADTIDIQIAAAEAQAKGETYIVVGETKTLPLVVEKLSADVKAGEPDEQV